jgi:glycogen debranching enzyme
LKSGYAFALFDHRGDIVAGEGNSDGIYLHDTRFLSQLELRLNGAPLLLLSSNVQEDNAVLTVDLANPELISRDGVALRGELIHVNRLKYIWQNACYERLLVHNFDTRNHDVRLGLRFAADFADLFEVRGQSRFLSSAGRPPASSCGTSASMASQGSPVSSSSRHRPGSMRPQRFMSCRLRRAKERDP